METILTTASLFATAILLGSMTFFSAVLAPLVFTKLEANVAGQFIRQVFPWYYLCVIALSGIAAVTAVPFRPVDAVVLANICIVGIFARQTLMPRINMARDAGASGDVPSQTRFSSLHKLSVWLNAAQMVAAAIILARFV